MAFLCQLGVTGNACGFYIDRVDCDGESASDHIQSAGYTTNR